MNLLGIVINDGFDKQVCYDPHYKSYEDIRNILDTVERVVLVYGDEPRPPFGIDLKKLFQIQDLLLFSDWNQLNIWLDGRESSWLGFYVTTAVVPARMQISDTESIPCPFGGMLDTQLNIISFENSDVGDVELGDVDEPYVRNNTHGFASNKDVVFSNIKHADVDNSIPIVCGCAFKPEVWNNPVTKKKELFALQAGRMLAYAKWNQKRTHTVSHAKVADALGHPVDQKYKGGELPMIGSYCYNVGPMLVDFSPVGTITVIGHKEFSDYHVAKTSPTQYELSVLLPDTVTSGIPIVGMFGRLFFLEKYVEKTETGLGIALKLRISKDLLERIIISNLQHYGKHIGDTTNVQVIIDLVLSNLFKDDKMNYGAIDDVQRSMYVDFQKPFVVMLHTDATMRMLRIQPKMVLKPDKLVFSRGAGGFLVNKNTMEIIDYVKVDYSNDTLVMYPLQCPLNVFDDSDPDRLEHPQLGHERYLCTNEPAYLKLSEWTNSLRDPDAFELLDFSYTRDN